MYKLIVPPAIPANPDPQPNTVLHIPSNTFIPFDPNNSSYQVYLEWLAEGNTPLPADE